MTMAGDPEAIELINMFPVPLLMQVDQCEDVNRRFVAEALARRSSEKGVDRSNRYGWHSNADFFQRKEPAIQTSRQKSGRSWRRRRSR